jgi:hypothetical protein
MTNKPDHDHGKRRHFIPEWAELRGKKQADIVRDLDIPKSVVFRWFSEGVIPTEKYLLPLAEYLMVDDVISLFRHPDDDWLAQMFRDKTDEQREKAVAMLKLFFESIGSEGKADALEAIKASRKR